MGRSRFKIKEDHFPYFITLSVVDGISLFDDPILSEIVLDSLKYMREKSGVKIYAFVLMHNHLHLVVEGDDLSGDIRKMKSFTARKMIDLLIERNRTLLLGKLRYLKHDHHKDSEYQVWQEGFHPKQISTPEMMTQKIDYIHYNPVKAGFVDVPEHWRSSSARNYLGLEGVIEVDVFTG